MNNSIQNILSRSSVRNFTGEKIPKETLTEIVRAGMAAPSAMNIQPWSFIVVTERSTLDNLRSGLPYAKMLEQAGAAIVVCGFPDAQPPFSGYFWEQDCSAVTQNILLAAHAMDFGAVWVGIHPIPDHVSYLRDILNIPKNIIPLSLIPIGIPAGDTPVKDKFKEEKIHFEKYQ